MIRYGAYCLLSIFILTASARADDIAMAFQEGRFQDVIAQKQEQTSQADRMLIARAYMILGGFYSNKEDALASLSLARGYVEGILKETPDHLEARLTYVLVIGFQAKFDKSASEAKRAKKLILEALELYPASGLTHGALAGWHSEVSAAGFMAKIFLGGSRSQAALSFQKALSYEPEDIPLLFQYGKFLARGNKAERQEAITIFSKVINQPTQEAVAILLQKKAIPILQALQEDNKNLIKQRILENSAYAVLYA